LVARAEDGGQVVRVDVEDSGIGLSPAEQAQLFTRFFRADNPTTRQVGGTGLGLVITRTLVQLHGGSLDVSSAPGQGSRFRFTLPIAAEAPSRTTRAALASSAAWSPPRAA
jgi:signal transduction histidine kinase